MKVLYKTSAKALAFHFRFAYDNRSPAFCCCDWRPANSRSPIVLFGARSEAFSLRIPAEDFQVHRIASSPDDQRITTSHFNTEIRIW